MRLANSKFIKIIQIATHHLSLYNNILIIPPTLFILIFFIVIIFLISYAIPALRFVGFVE